MFGRDWPLYVCLTLSGLFLLPSVWLLGTLYLASSTPAQVTGRKLLISLSGMNRQRRLLHEMTVTVRLKGETNDRTWNQQLPLEHPLEVIAYFDQYPPGRELPVWLSKDGKDVYLQRGLPEGRFGLGIGLGVFGVVFLIFGLVYLGMNGNPQTYWGNPRRTALIFGLIPLAFGTWFGWQLYQRYFFWNHVEVTTTEFKPIDIYTSRAPDITLKDDARQFLEDRTMEALQFTHKGQHYLSKPSRTLSCTDCLLASNPAEPTNLADIPEQTFESLAGAILPLAFGLFFTVLALWP